MLIPHGFCDNCLAYRAGTVAVKNVDGTPGHFWVCWTHFKRLVARRGMGVKV